MRYKLLLLQMLTILPAAQAQEAHCAQEGRAAASHRGSAVCGLAEKYAQVLEISSLSRVDTLTESDAHTKRRIPKEVLEFFVLVGWSL